jgi:hypothetical protein
MVIKASGQKWDTEHVLEDTGCNIGGPSCLACPLPKCRHEMSWSEISAVKQEQHDARLTATWAPGMSVSQFAALHGITERTVYRIKARSRKAHVNCTGQVGA